MGKNHFEGIDAEVLKGIEHRLVDDESRYQREQGTARFSSLWSHSVRVAHIAHRLARDEKLNASAAILAALFHDVGKFWGGVYHQDDVAEEERAVAAAREVLAGTCHEELLPVLGEAILSLYRDDVEPCGIGAVLYDADRLDKLGCTGIAQFFTKNALRGRFLNNGLLMQASIELTYAYHGPRTLKTETGRRLAKVRSTRVREFFLDLLGEWKEMDMGAFSLQEVDVEGITLILLMPDHCHCGSRVHVDTDIRESVKCRSAVVIYGCPRCDDKNEFSFCLPALPTLFS